MALGTFRALVFMGVTGGNGEAILQISPQPVQTVMKGSQGLRAIWLLRGKGNGVRRGEEITPMDLQKGNLQGQGSELTLWMF